MKNILICRTDRIGDVLLSTPVFEVLKRELSSSRITVLVGPHAKEIVEGNPYVDEVLVYDKKGEHRSFWRTFLFSRFLKKKKFDSVILLHSTNRVVIMAFLAGIPERIGYDRRLSFLLTKSYKYVKKHGTKHEVDYNLDLIKSAYAIKSASHAGLSFPLKESDKKTALEKLYVNFRESEKFIVFHTHASCPSKRWPKESFCKLAKLIRKHFDIKVIAVALKQQDEISRMFSSILRDNFLDLSGRLSLGELAWILKQAALFVSNDSGPVHLSVAVGTPCISIFGRKDPGLSPTRWAPLGERDIVFHKDVGCLECKAHECELGFKCIGSVLPEEVFEEVKNILDTRF